MCYKKRLFSEVRTLRRNPYLKAVDYVIHGKLHDSWKTTWFMKNYVIHVGPVETTWESLFFLWKTTWFIKNYVIHEKLRESWKNCWWLSRWKKSRRPSGPFSTVGINTFDIHEKHDLNREIRKTRGFMKTQGFRPSPEGRAAPLGLHWKIFPRESEKKSFGST